MTTMGEDLDTEGLRGVNTTCPVCGNDYSDEEHIENCINSPENWEGDS